MNLKVLLIIGVVPLRSAKSAQWMKEKLFGTIIPDAFVARMDKAADPVAEGRRICIEVIEQMADIRGVSGVHVMAPNNDAAVPEVIAAARDSIKRLAVA